MAVTYTVQGGDSWEKIAGKIYGDQRMFEDLMRANGGLAHLRPGMTLRLPGKRDNPFVSPKTAFREGMAVPYQFLQEPNGRGATDAQGNPFAPLPVVSSGQFRLYGAPPSWYTGDATQVTQYGTPSPTQEGVTTPGSPGVVGAAGSQPKGQPQEGFYLPQDQVNPYAGNAGANAQGALPKSSQVPQGTLGLGGPTETPGRTQQVNRTAAGRGAGVGTYQQSTDQAYIQKYYQEAINAGQTPAQALRSAQERQQRLGGTGYVSPYSTASQAYQPQPAQAVNPPPSGVNQSGVPGAVQPASTGPAGASPSSPGGAYVYHATDGVTAVSNVAPGTPTSNDALAKQIAGNPDAIRSALTAPGPSKPTYVSVADLMNTYGFKSAQELQTYMNSLGPGLYYRTTGTDTTTGQSADYYVLTASQVNGRTTADGDVTSYQYRLNLLRDVRDVAVPNGYNRQYLTPIAQVVGNRYIAGLNSRRRRAGGGGGGAATGGGPTVPVNERGVP